MKAFKEKNFQIKEHYDPRFWGYQTAMAYAIQPDHSSSDILIWLLPPYTPIGAAYYRL